MKKATLILLFLLTSLLWITIPSVRGAWLSGWTFRKSHIVNGASGAGTNYQINITTYYGSGSDSGSKVYLDGNCRSDFGDIRFTDNDETTLLDYWIEELSEGSYALFWVEVQDDLSSQTTIYLYYGKSDATSIANGDNTFLEFTHFEGSDLPDDWEEKDADMGYYAVSDSVLHVESDSASHSTWYHRVVGTDSTFSLPVRVRQRVLDWRMSSSRKGIMTGIGDCADGAGGYYHDTRHVVYMIWDGSSLCHATKDDGNLDNQNIADPPSEATWEFLTNATGVGSLLINDALIDNGDYPPTDDLYVTIGVISGSGTGTTGYIDVDWIFVSKFISPEPSHGSWGSQEGFVAWITFKFYFGGQFRVDNATVVNGSQTYYVNNTVIELASLPSNQSWVFVMFSWGSGNSSTNPYNFTVHENATIWMILRDPPLKGTPQFFVGFVVIAGLIAFTLILAIARRRKRD